jgi:hypothetical protein
MILVIGFHCSQGEQDNKYFVAGIIGKLTLDGVKNLFETVINNSQFSY